MNPPRGVRERYRLFIHDRGFGAGSVSTDCTSVTADPGQPVEDVTDLNHCAHAPHM
jgi:hypothetical protein